jgi:hypothetical protein
MNPVHNQKYYMTHVREAQAGTLKVSPDKLPEEFCLAAMEKVGEAKRLADRVKEVQKEDKGTDKAARYVRAFFWGALGAVGIVTVVPAIAYAVTGLILHKDPLNWSRRLSVKPEKELLEEDWSQMCKNWKANQLINPYSLAPSVSIDSSTTQEDCATIIDNLNALFSSSLDKVEKISTELLGVNEPR